MQHLAILRRQPTQELFSLRRCDAAQLGRFVAAEFTVTTPHQISPARNRS